MRIDDDQRRWRLARRHLLVERDAATASEVADALVALHSSDPASVFLSVSARSPDASVADVERALYDDRTMVRHHAMRRTLWVMTPEVAAAAHAACTRKIAAAERKRTAGIFGRDEDWLDDAIERVVAVVSEHREPMSTKEIGGALPDLTERVEMAQGKQYAGTISAHTRILLQAAFEARVTRTRPAGTWVGTQYAWTPAGRWVDVGWDDHDVETGHGRLVERWLAAFGPGTLEDIVWWTGSTKTSIRRALSELDATEVELDADTGYVLPDDDVEEAEPDPWVALLPGLDPTAMGWKHRAWYLAPDVAERVVDRNGNIGPTVWVDGRVVGGWAQRPDGTIAHDADVPRTHRSLFDAEVERIVSFVGDTRFRVRFPSPNQRDLLA